MTTKNELKKLLRIEEKEQEIAKIEKQMNQPDFWKDHQKAGQISQELQKLKDQIEQFNSAQSADEIAQLETQALMQGKYDDHNAYLTISAGTGGTDAQDWAEMLLRMYLRLAEQQGWKKEVIDKRAGKEAGIKSASLYISGNFAFGYLKAEAGVHRLVRKSPFNAQNLRQTSFALVEVIPELDDKEIELNDSDLRIETFRSSGPGGQSVNTTDSAVRITHLPTKQTVSVQNQKSQIQNKQTALKILASKLQSQAKQEQKKEAQEAQGETKSAQWGNQIRSYVLDPYQQVKDHRTNIAEKNVQSVLDGNLMPFIEGWLKKK